jgi:prepilin-type N-terminal cleavage/methylation domain-containing protein
MRSRNGLQGPGAEGGFTLVELLVAIVIIGVITVPLSDVLVSYLHNTDATMARLLESHDVQIASAYWAQDVASIGTRSAAPPYPLTQSVETGAPYTYPDPAPGDPATGVTWNSGQYPCGTALTPGTPRAVVRLAWDDFSGFGPANVVRVAYVVAETAAGQHELHRLRCEGPAATPLIFTLVSDVVLAHDLDASTPPAVECLGTSGSDCAPVPAAAVPTKVTLRLSLKDPKNRDGAYVVPLTGQRRQS